MVAVSTKPTLRPSLRLSRDFSANFRRVKQAMSFRVPQILLLAACLSGCAKSAGPVSPAAGHGYEYIDEPRGDAEKTDAKLPVSCARAPCPTPMELETPSGRVRLDACGDCPAPYACYLDPLADLRLLPGADQRPADVFECSKPSQEGLTPALNAEVAPRPPRRSCPLSRQRYWFRNGARFACCLFDEPVGVECYAE